MLQRTVDSSRAPEDHVSVDIPPQLLEQRFGPRRVDIQAGVHFPANGRYAKYLFWRTNFWRSNWVHALPVFIILCIFILWWFSYPVHLPIHDGDIEAVNLDMFPEFIDTKNRVEYAVLALTTSPIAPIPQELTVHIKAEAYPAAQIG